MSRACRSPTSNGNTSSRRLFLQAAAVSAGATLALSPSPGLNQQAREDPDVSAQDNEGILYREKDPDGELMKGFPPPSDKHVMLDNYTTSLDHTRWAFQNPHVLFRTAEISRGTRDVRPLARRTCDEASLDALEVPRALEYKDAEPLTVKDWLSLSQTDALIVLRDGEILAEIYFGDMRPDTRHFCWSVGKGFLAAVVGRLMARGKLAENDVVKHRVPELARTGLSGATVRQLLDQTSGIAFKEFPAPGDDEATIDGLTFGSAANRTSRELLPSYPRTCGILPLTEGEVNSEGVYDFLFQLSLRDRPHGNALWYAEPHVAALQLIVERITGRSFVEELGDRIWSKLGAERSGLAITDRLGTATNGTGLCVTARDAARFGQMILDMGRVEGEEVTGDEADRYRFRVSMLRNVAKTRPYFHDGSVAALEDAVQVMAEVQLGSRLSKEDASAIASFLGALTGELPRNYSRASDASMSDGK